MAVAGLVMGIIGIALGFFPYACFAAFPIAIIGLVLSVVAGKKEKNGVATAGLVIGIIAVVLTAITFFTCGICVVAVAGIESTII